MSTSDTIAAVALAISLMSLWLSYRAVQSARMVSAAEKRTQAHSILVNALLEAQELLALVRGGIVYKGTDSTLLQQLGALEGQLKNMTERIPERLNWLRERNSDDPVLLEEYKTYALDVESRIKRVAPMIREVQVRTESGAT